MKKISSLLIALILSVTFAYSQAFYPQNITVNFDLGLINTFGWGKVKVPPLQLSADYGLTNAGPGVISVGLLVAYARTFDSQKYGSHSSGATSEYYYTYDYVLPNLRLGYHFSPNQSDKLDLYAGFLAGYNIIVGAKYDNNIHKSINDPPAPEKSHFLGGVFAGARFYFTDRFGVNTELGYGISVFNIGVSYKF